MVFLRTARGALLDGDSLAARRALVEAIRSGIGRPEAHAVLGEVLRSRNSKYALLETLVACRLKPDDWVARRDLVAGLVAARLDGPARTELEQLRAIHPGWERDSVTAVLVRTLEGRDVGSQPVAKFGPTSAR